MKKGYTYADAINQVLDDYIYAATKTEHEAACDNHRFTAPQMLAEISRRYANLVADRTGVPALPPIPEAAPLGFLAQFDRWIAQERGKI